MSWRAKAGIGFGFLLLIGMMYFALAQPVQVLPFMAPVPTFELVDDQGDPFRLHDQVGKVGIYTFGPSRDEAGVEAVSRLFHEFNQALQGDPELADLVEWTFITIDAEHDTPEALAALRPRFERHAGPSIPLRFLTGSWVALRLAVGTAFGVYYEPPPEDDPAPSFTYEPAVIIVDWNGVMRARYAPNEVSTDILMRDMRLLGREMKAQGAQRWMYAGAHLFLCYPR